MSSFPPALQSVENKEPILVAVHTPQGSLVVVLWLKVTHVVKNALHNTQENFSNTFKPSSIDHAFRPIVPLPSLAAVQTRSGQTGLGQTGLGQNREGPTSIAHGAHLPPSHQPQKVAPPSAGEMQGKGSKQENSPSHSSATTPSHQHLDTPAEALRSTLIPNGKILPENLEKLLISFVALTVASMKPHSQKSLHSSLDKESNQPEMLIEKPSSDSIRIDPQLETEQGDASPQDQQNPSAFFREKTKQLHEGKAASSDPLAKEMKGDLSFSATTSSIPLNQKESELFAAHIPFTSQSVHPVDPNRPASHPIQSPVDPLTKQEPLAQRSIQPQQPPSKGLEPVVNPSIGLGASTPAQSEKVTAIVPPVDAVKIIEIEAKNSKPRIDAIAPKEGTEPTSKPTVKNNEERRIEFRLPITPELPFSREDDLKKNPRSNASLKLSSEGYRFGDVITMIVAAVVCGARTVPEIYRYLDQRSTFFISWLGLKQSIPKMRTIWWLFQRLQGERFQELVQEALAAKNSFIYQLQIWDSDRGVIFGEPLSLPKRENSSHLSSLLGFLDVEYAAITIDSSHLNPSIADQIARKKGDYIVAIRGAHGALYEKLQDYFEGGQKEGMLIHHDASKEGERSEQRELRISRNLDPLNPLIQQFGSNLKTAIRLHTETFFERRLTTDLRYYLSSLDLPADAMAATLRILSLVEKRVEWMLDCDFGRTAEPLTTDHSSNNLITLIKASWNLFEKENSVKGSFETKRQKASQDNSYLRTLLGTP